MIERILCPETFRKVIDDLYELFKQDDKKSGHEFLIHSPESIKNSLGHKSLLAWDFFVWANRNTKGNYDALIIFYNDKSFKFGTKIFSEFLWISKNPKAGIKLLQEAKSFAKKQKFPYIVMSTVINNPSYNQLRDFYKKMGFKKDSETYISKL